MVVPEFPVVLAAVTPHELAVAVLEAVDEVALVEGAIDPTLDSVAVLFVAQPLAGVAGAVLVQVDSVALGLVVHPGPLVDVAVGVHQSSHAVGHIVLPVALVKGSVFEEVLASAGSDTFVPLSDVDVAVLEFDRWLPFVGKGLFIVEWAELFQSLFDELVGDLGGRVVGRGRCGLWVHQHEVGAGLTVNVIACLAVAHLKFLTIKIINNNLKGLC